MLIIKLSRIHLFNQKLHILIQTLWNLNIQQIQIQHLLQMSYYSIQKEVDELFDRAEHPNIAHRDDDGIIPLLKKVTFPITPALSIQIIKDVLEAIMYVSSHLLIYKPCQVFKQHVIEKAGRWGLMNIICYRDPKQNPSFDPDRYYPKDYYEHDDQDSELTWSLGRMWFFMLTDSAIPPIKNLNDKQIESTIENSGINDARIIGLLKGILVIDKSKRKNLSQIIQNGLFEYQQQSKIYSKIVKNQFESKIGKSKINSVSIQHIPFNPYEQQLFKRDFKQAIVIADFMKKVRYIILNRFENSEDNNETAFSCYLIDLMSYVRMRNLKMKGQKLNYMLVLLYDRVVYTSFLKKIVELEDSVERKRRNKKFDRFKKVFPSLFNPPEDLKKQQYENQLYRSFTTYISHYAKYLKQQRNLNAESKDYKNYVILINLMLVRSSNYVFGNCRKFIFKDFINDQVFNLENVLQNIQKCTDVVKLNRIEMKITDIYFKNKEQNND